MLDNISCPQCRRILEVPEDSRGREVCCPECKHAFVASAPTGITAQAPNPVIPHLSDVQPGMPPRGPVPFSANEDEFTDEDDSVREMRQRLIAFRSASGLAFAVKILLGLNVLTSLAMFGSEYLQYQLSVRLVARQPVLDAELAGNDVRQMAIGLSHTVIYLASAILFVIWFYRVHANLKPLGARRLTYTSGWAAGYWFVPILNLVRPVQIAQEIWRHSDPDAVSGKGATNSALVGFWWAMWIFSNVISQIAMRMTWSVNTPESLRSASLANMVADVVTIPTALLALAVVASIDFRQTARAEALSMAIDTQPEIYE